MALHVNETGPASAPTIVFLHGSGIGSWMWDPQVKALADYHLLVPDLPEHGRSAVVKPFTMADAGARVTELIRTRAHNGRAHLVGLSLGAQLGAYLLGTVPEVVDHAVLSGCLARAFPGMKWLYPSVSWMYKMYEPFKDAAWLIRANMDSAGIPRQYFAEVREDTRLLTVEALTHILTENMEYRPAAALGRAAAPTLILAGETEYGIMRQSARDLRQALPHAKAYLAPRLGHSWNLQKPDLFNRTVRAWISDQPLPSELIPLK